MFLPRDAMRKRRLAVGRCLSVCMFICPFVTFMYSIQTAEDIVKFLSRPGSLINQFFDHEQRYQPPRETPSAGASNRQGREFAIFDRNRR